MLTTIYLTQYFNVIYLCTYNLLYIPVSTGLCNEGEMYLHQHNYFIIIIVRPEDDC
jgi:hypothetical protein